MIWIRKEGEACQRGLNLMRSPHYRVFFMWGTYNYRLKLGVGWRNNRVYFWRNFWTRRDDIRIDRLIRGLRTPEEVDDIVQKKMSEASKSRGYTK